MNLIERLESKLELAEALKVVEKLMRGRIIEFASFKDGEETSAKLTELLPFIDEYVSTLEKKALKDLLRQSIQDLRNVQ